MNRRTTALLLASATSKAPRIADASEVQRATAAGALPAALSAGAIAMDLSGTRPARIFYGDTQPAQVLSPAGFPTGVQSGIGVGTLAWPMLPKRRVAFEVP